MVEEGGVRASRWPRERKEERERERRKVRKKGMEGLEGLRIDERFEKRSGKIP